MTIQNKLILYVSTTVFIFCLIFWAITYTLIKNVSSADGSAASLRDKNQLSYHLDIERQQIINKLVLMAQNPELKKAILSGNPENALKLLTANQANYQLPFMELVLPPNRVYSLTGTPESFKTAPNSPFLYSFTAQKAIYCFTQSDSSFYVKIAQPVSEARGQNQIGVIISGFPIGDALLSRLNVLTGADIFFVSANNKVLSSSPDSRIRQYLQADNDSPLTTDFDNIINISKPVQISLGSASRYFSVIPAKNELGLIIGYLGISREQPSVFQQYGNPMLIILSFSLMVAFIAGLLSVWFIKKQFYPLAALSDDIRAITRANTYDTIILRSRNEIGTLTIRMNRLIRQLKKRTDDLQNTVNDRDSQLNKAHEKLAKYTDNMERMVAKRTHELREKDEILIQSGKLANLGEMATGIAHEINQPLNVIKLIATGLLRQYGRSQSLDTTMVVGELQTINQQIIRLQKIIHHMKTFSRKTVKLDMQPIDINLPVKNAFLLIGQQLTNRGIDFNLDLSENLPNVYAEPTQIEQVVINIINNARDALDEKAALLKRTDRNSFDKLLNVKSVIFKRRVCLEISDNGTGMNEEVKSQMFEPFYTTKKAGKGTGLGMSISYNLLRNLGAEIDVRSILGEGTTFTLSFPPTDLSGIDN